MILLTQLFLAHIVGDFFLQFNPWLKHKTEYKLRSWFFYVHGCIHFLLVLLLVGKLTFWKSALLIAILHLIADGIKLILQKPGNARFWFFINQGIHFLVILCVWGWSEKMVIDWQFFSKPAMLMPLTGLVFLLNPTSYIIRMVIAKWQPVSDVALSVHQSSTAAEQLSLESAGKLIGMLERVLVFVFIYMGRWEGVGFLLAAKSVFRFGDLKDAHSMKLTEYVLIGTLLSFGIAIVTGIIILP
jgi:hypothetical protein